jgi:hypothetical protein
MCDEYFGKLEKVIQHRVVEWGWAVGVGDGGSSPLKSISLSTDGGGPFLLAFGGMQSTCRGVWPTSSHMFGLALYFSMMLPSEVVCTPAAAHANKCKAVSPFLSCISLSALCDNSIVRQFCSSYNTPCAILAQNKCNAVRSSGSLKLTSPP